MVWYPRRPPKIHHWHVICSISESRPPICLQFAAFQSPNLRLAAYLQHLKAICYLHTTYVPFIVSICFFYLVYLYTGQAIAYLHSAHWLPLIGIFRVLYPYIILYIYIWITYIPLVAKQIIYTDVIHIYTIIYNLYLYATSKTARPQPPTTGGGGNYMVYDCFAAW